MKTPAILKLAYRRPLRFLYCVAFSFWYFARHVLDGLRYMATPAREAPIARDKREILYIIANIDFFKDANHVVGGHITHVLGVIRGLAKAGYRVHVLTTQAVPFLDQPDCIQHVIAPERTLPELPLVDYLPWHRQLYRDALRLVGERPIAFIYQRHTNLVFSGCNVSSSRCITTFTSFNACSASLLVLLIIIKSSAYLTSLPSVCPFFSHTVSR